MSGLKAKDSSDILNVCDIISALIRCHTDKSYILVYHPNHDYYLPSLPLNNKKWGATCKELTNKYIGEELLPDRLTKIVRIWNGDNKPYLINSVFEFIISLEQKSKLKLPDWIPYGKEKVMWLKAQEVLRLIQLEMLTSPELKMFFSQGGGDQEMKLLKDSADVISNFVIEVSRDHILCSEPRLTPDAMISSLKLEEHQLTILYREYLKLCYPHILMSLKNFRKFCCKLQWPDNMVNSLFRMGDKLERTALTFRELLGIIAFMEPDILYVGNGPEIRCKMIFRYFDSDKDGKLNMHEFKSLIQATREGTNTLITLEKDVEKGYKEIGLSPGAEILLKDFLMNVGLLKFRNINSIVKSKLPIKSYIRNCKLLETEDGGVQSTEAEYTVAWHTVKVGKVGVKEITNIMNTEGFMSLSSSKLQNLKTENSVTMFNPSTVENLALVNLKYYTQLLSQKVSSQKDYKKVMSTLSNQLIQLSKLVINIFGSEPRLLRITSPVYILGDLHGNFPDVCCFERTFWNMGIHLTPVKMLLLGDYVDRGSYGVEVIAYLFAQKVRNPDKIFLIRGNHELRDIQKNFTFHAECLRKFGDHQGSKIWEEINKAFDYMPLAAVIDNKIFCCHGGIPAPWLCPHIEYINKVPVPLSKPDEESTLAWDLLWNDPIREDHTEDDLQQELNNNEGFALNRRRGTAHVFDAGALSRFLNNNKLSYVIRAHEVQQAGIQIQLNQKMLTVFSSSFYNGGNNDAACILAFNKKLRIFRIDTTEFHKVRD